MLLPIVIFSDCISSRYTVINFSHIVRRAQKVDKVFLVHSPFLSLTFVSARETWVQSPGWEDRLEKGKATPSSILAWRKESYTTE